MVEVQSWALCLNLIYFNSCFRLLLFVDEADAFLRRRSTV